MSSAASDRYTLHSILRSERIYGIGMQSPGGGALLNILMMQLPTAPKIILAIGCGFDGECAALARKFPSASIHGIDISEVMVQDCKKRWDMPNLSFAHGDMASSDRFEPQRFDVIWIRDVLLYCPDKVRHAGSTHLNFFFETFITAKGPGLGCFGTSRRPETRFRCPHSAVCLLMGSSICIMKGTGPIFNA